ncbi:unnamed protein product, partial [Oikopleura dioica]
MLVLASILALCAAAPADSTCPMINQRDQGLDVLPKYPLDPEKFITPIYIWGPSSQLQGLREAIGVAIRLNRTLLLPPFLTHSSDPLGNDQPVPTDIRLDIPELRKLVSVAFTDDLHCLQSDAVFLARGIYNKPTDPAVMVERVKRIENFEKAAHMKVLRRTDDDEVDENAPFLESAIPVTRSPKVSGAGVQLTIDRILFKACTIPPSPVPPGCSRTTPTNTQLSGRLKTRRSGRADPLKIPT